MGTKPVDISGKKFGCYTALRPVRAGTKASRGVTWELRCDCGQLVEKRTTHLRFFQCRHVHRGGAPAAHWASEQPEYEAWKMMRRRCRDPKQKDFLAYGGRGIRVCERWDNFWLFLEDMGRRPSPEMTIERVDVNGNYEPSNCMWLHRSLQFLNTQRTPQGVGPSHKPLR